MLGTLLSTKKRKKEKSFICYLFSWVDLGLGLKWPNWLVLGKERRQLLLFSKSHVCILLWLLHLTSQLSSDPLMKQETDLDISLKYRKFLRTCSILRKRAPVLSPCCVFVFLPQLLSEFFFSRRNIRWLVSVMLLIQSYILGTLSVKFAFLNSSGYITITCNVFLLCGNMLISQ